MYINYIDLMNDKYLIDLLIEFVNDYGFKQVKQKFNKTCYLKLHNEKNNIDIYLYINRMVRIGKTYIYFPTGLPIYKLYQLNNKKPFKTIKDQIFYTRKYIKNNF